ncbi:hypothetical protein Vadar_033663 [Vaccinium darrowii]|uniref:Uncharacterized protein n=1 Tax=Vaccinium darrowii TaxID=229202 RepID=A0ACB7YAV8_9ERIC|nr:hypothetical protein Vadar_033663 [Vaccinium darrowii]
MGLAANPITSVVLIPLLLSLLVPAATPVAAKLKTSNIKFDYFNGTYNLGVFQVDDLATIHNDALQVTPDSVNSAFLINQAVVCGKRPWTQINGYLVDWVWALHRECRLLRAVDNRLGGDYKAEEVERVLLLGLACSHPTASERPKTQEIVQILSGSVDVPHVPGMKPAFVWSSPPMGVEDICPDFTTDNISPQAIDPETQHQNIDRFNYTTV